MYGYRVIPKLSLFLLQKLYLWPKNGDIINRRFYTKSLIFYLLISIPSFDSMLHFLLRKTDEVEIIFFHLNLIVAYFTCSLIFGIYMYKLPLIVDTVSEVRYIITLNKEFFQLRATLNQMTKFVLTIAVCLISIYGIYRVTEEAACERRLKSYEGKYYCGTFVPSYASFGTKKFYLKKIISVLQTCGVILFYWTLYALFMLCVWGVRLIILQMRELQKCLNELPLGQNRSYYERFLKEFAASHYGLYRLAKSLDQCTCSIHFVHVTTGSVMFMVGFAHAYFNKQYISLTQAGGWFLSLFYLSHLSQTLINEGEALSRAVYDIKWHDMGVTVKPLILIILQMSQKPIYMYAGPINYLAYPTFLQLVRAASSYWTLYVNVTSK